MLDQENADRLLNVFKKLVSVTTVQFPAMGCYLVLDAVDLGEKEQFKIDAQRRGRKKSTKCTYQMRYCQTEILLRVDIDGPPHDNPDGETIHCPHIHIYREGYADGWAISLPPGHFPTPTDLEETLKDFLRYCKITDLPVIQRTMV